MRTGRGNEAALEGLRQHLAAMHYTFVGTEGFTFESLELEHSAFHAPGQIHEHTYPRPPNRRPYRRPDRGAT